MDELESDRIAREKAFHDDRFSEETRTHQAKYYAALAHCFEDYESRCAELAVGADVLEYGCALGENSLEMAATAKTVTGIDISDVAVAKATAAASAAGLTNTSFAAMNAEAMSFDDNSFDFIFGSGIIHHLDIDRAYKELHRVLRPGGRVLFVEPMGHNPVVNLYRRMTPAARTEDEHPLVREDTEVFTTLFSAPDIKTYGLSTLAAVPFRDTGLFKPLLGATAAVDRLLFKLPGAKWMAWFVLLEGQKV